MPMVLVLQLWLVGFGAAANAFKAEERLHSNAVSASNKDSPSAEGILPDKNEVPGELLSKPMELILIGVSRLLAEALEESRLWRTIVGWLNALVKLVATTLGIDKFEQKNSVPSVSTASNSVLRGRITTVIVKDCATHKLQNNSRQERPRIS